VSVRPADWARDAEAIRAIDTSFTTDRVYRFGRERGGFGFAFPLVTTTPVTKSYPLPDEDPGPGSFVAEAGGEVAGFAQVEEPGWNGRAVVRHLYVSAPRRGQGLGTGLVEAVSDHARAAGARYLRRGFYLCGFDESFYDPVETPGEFAFFFSLPLL
jgi:GNAT superfamily N-acetyltransferase